MSRDHYVMDPGGAWKVPVAYDSVFTWDYDDGREKLLTLYQKGKQKQWDADFRIDWSIPVDPRDPKNVPDSYIAIYGSPWWNKMNEEERATVRHHVGAWTNSQFLHGEQGALISAAKIVTAVPDADAKFYAATQVMDEARHVEVFERYLRTKTCMAYPINPELKQLLEQVVNDKDWDLTYLGMQIMIEGLALAAFGMMRDYTNEPLFASINAYVMQDEARHVAFGVQALDDFYTEMSSGERNIREEFVVEACYLMRDRLLAPEVWEYLGLPKKQVLEWVDHSMAVKMFRKMLFSRIVPNIKKIGLWGPKIQACFADLGVLFFQNMDAEEAFATDEAAAARIDEYVAQGYSLNDALVMSRADAVSQTVARGRAVEAAGG